MESGSVGTLKTEEIKIELSARLISAVRTRQGCFLIMTELFLDLRYNLTQSSE